MRTIESKSQSLVNCGIAKGEKSIQIGNFGSRSSFVNNVITSLRDMRRNPIVRDDAQSNGINAAVDGPVCEECARLVLENGILARENQRLQQNDAELIQLRVDCAIANRELADIRARLEAATATIQRLENEKDGLIRELDGLRTDQLKWFRPLAVSIREPIITVSPSSPDFSLCVSGWNRMIVLNGRGDFSSEVIPLTCSDEWELRGWFRFTGRPDMFHYIALDCYTDTEGRSENRITDRCVMRVGETEAVLAADCNSGDRILKLRGASVASWPSKLKV
jgi:hypothetical protein